MKMAKENIEVRVRQKTLSVKGKELKLEDNFEGVGVFIICNKKDETILELNYRKKENFSPEDEAERVDGFLRNSKIKLRDVYSNREEDYKKEVFPAITITGEFETIVYR